MKQKIATKTKVCLTVIFLFFTFATTNKAGAATYKWYFSDDASGNMGIGNDQGTAEITDCQESTPCRSLTKAQDMLDLMTNSDTATLYFDSGDTWTITGPSRSFSTSSRITDWSSGRDGVLWHDSGTVTITSYGSGSRPIFDGGETFSDCPLTRPTEPGKNTSDAIIMTNNAGNLTVRNIEMKRFHGNGIAFNRTTTNVVVENCKITYMGAAGITHAQFNPPGAITGAIIQNNEIGYVQQNWHLFECSNAWGGAIHLQGGSENIPAYGSYNILVRYNRIYNSGGEGIVVGSYEHPTYSNIVEYNVISDTAHVAIHTPTTYADAGKIIVRYNLMYWTSAGIAAGYESYGMNFYDEEENRPEADGGGDNSTADYQFYGNTVINGSLGMWLQPTEDPWGKIWIYNNSFIDCDFSIRITAWFDNPVIDGRFFNNAAIYYERNAKHLYDPNTQNSRFSNWTMSNNVWYGGTVPDAPWNTNQITGDPKLKKTTGWRSLSNMPAVEDFTPEIGSSLIGSGFSLGSGFSKSFLTPNSNFSSLPESPNFNLRDQINGAWDIGAIINNSSLALPSAPSGLQVL